MFAHKWNYWINSNNIPIAQLFWQWSMNLQEFMYTVWCFSPQGFGGWLPAGTGHLPCHWGPIMGLAPSCSGPGTASERCHSEGWAGPASTDLSMWSYTFCMQNMFSFWCCTLWSYLGFTNHRNVCVCVCVWVITSSIFCAEQNLLWFCGHEMSCR